jgi:WD40 repeat protein
MVVLGFAALPGVVACVFLVAVGAGQGLERASLWAAVLGMPVGLVAAGAAVWVIVAPQSKVRVSPKLEVPGWVVDRPSEVSAVVAALLGGQAGTVGITTSLQGAGGFGKTTLALIVGADPRVRRRFRGYVDLVTVGRDVRGAAAVAAKVNDVIKLVSGEDASFTDPELAGRRLGALLDDGPRRLLILDDVWEPEQLVPFTAGGLRCARLVTTRVPGLLAGRGTTVRVDQMSPEQARALLVSGLPPLEPALVTGLLGVTGRWPLLLRLANKILANVARAGADVPAGGVQLLARLEASGPAVVDDLTGEGSRILKVGQPKDRARAVRATIEASTGLLDPQDARRFAELGVFAEDETIPFSLAALLWRATGGLDDLETSQLLARLGELALVSSAGTAAGGATLHDVVRDFLRGELGQAQLAELNGTLLDASAARLPTADTLDPAAPGPSVAWWDLRQNESYLWDHLIEHLLDAGRRSGADAVAGDLRWAGARLKHFGPAAPAADLARMGTPRAVHLQAALARVSHLLAPTEPNESVVDVLHSRVAADPEWGPQVTALRDICHRPRLVNRWPPPDLADPALQRVLTGHTSLLNAVAVAPDGRWLATASSDGTARIWDAATGQQRAVLAGHTGWVRAVAVAPDGSWLATTGSDRKVRIWEAATGQQRTLMAGHAYEVTAVAVAPDGSWLATSSSDRTARIWDAATGQQRAVLAGHTDSVTAVAVAPDGSWLATASSDRTARIWDAATGQQRAVLAGHTGWVNAVAVAPDGGWLVTAGSDGTTRIWDAATGQQRAVLAGHTDSVYAVAVAPDGRWLATVGSDGTTRIWDAATGQQRAVLAGHSYEVKGVAVAPDGSWLVTAGDDRTVRIWDAATGQQRAELASHQVWVKALAVAPDGSWLATAGDDRTARIWDAATGQQRAVLASHSGWVNAVTVAPDGSWLVTASGDETARIWDAATGQQRAVLASHTGEAKAVVVAPDGSWLATASSDQTARIWDAATGQQRAVLASHTGEVKAVAVAPDGSWLATASGDETARIWDAATGQQRAVLASHAGEVNAVVVAPDGSWLATASGDETARIWDAATGQQRIMLASHTGEVNAVAVAPDSSWLATASGDGAARIWDAASGQQRAVLAGHTGEVKAVAVVPHGRWLATVGDDRTVRIWDWTTGKAIALMRVENTIRACAWINDEGLALVGAAGLYGFNFLPALPQLPPDCDTADHLA